MPTIDNGYWQPAGTAAWITWNSTSANLTATTATVSTTAVWAAWTTAYTGTLTEWSAAPARPLTDAERLARAERDERRERDEEARRAARAEAYATAEALLMEALTADQAATYCDLGYIEGVTSNGCRYRINTRQGISGNVEVHFRGDEWLRVCAHPGGRLPNPDVFLAQKLALEADVETFLHIANPHGTVTRRAAA